MERAEKQALVASLHEVFSDAASVVVVHYDGLTVAEMTNLRARMREVGASFKVTKNRLTRLALKGTEYEGIGDLLTGPTAIGYAADPVAAPKAIAAFAKENEKLRILGGGMGSTVLDINGVKALADLPSLDELRGKLVGLLQAPAQKLAAVTQAPAGQLARVFGAYGAKDAA
ncbi:MULTISPECIES: 50S ribosomal protein L10 [Kordiimonadales]|uniref:Large ribosomal subunit protein uL10 n=1 Tax=Gimibacter soli TaxID=3024400 RepID=A0AAE9XUY0_9PROT|nr:MULTISPECIES: 50S ribosomal protein L10 [Kordiimonadales]WCL55626.1 50S ribosomal protein L10 [Gimibacter soli]